MAFYKGIWVAPFVETTEDEEGNPVNIYDKPYFIQKATINSVSGNTEFMVYGERVKSMCKTVINYAYLNKIKERDLIFIYGAKVPQEGKNSVNINVKGGYTVKKLPNGSYALVDVEEKELIVNEYNANYVVDAVMPHNIKMTVYMERLPNR